MTPASRELPPLLFLDRCDVESLLPMAEAIEVMAETFAALARGEAVQPLRSALWTADHQGLLGTMPGHLDRRAGGEVRRLTGAKLVTVFHANHEQGLDSHQGFVLLFEAARGVPLAILDAASVTAIRTAAVSGLATRLLARAGACDLAILGSGVQAATHLAALRAVRPIARVRVWSRNPDSARRFAAAEGARHGLPIEVAGEPAAAVAGADLVCTVTAAREPVLRGEWLAAGAHVNAVGSCSPAVREIDAAVVARARLFVDSRESALAEAGDLLLAIAEGAVGKDHIQGELGDLVAGRLRGRRGEDEITLFESLGLAVEDLAAAHHVYEKALAGGRGTALPR
ncbi:MAG TPA: ornithine cyclodeaminase family protein [Thermoanaerobaculia bacterium]